MRIQVMAQNWCLLPGKQSWGGKVKELVVIVTHSGSSSYELLHGHGISLIQWDVEILLVLVPFFFLHAVQKELKALLNLRETLLVL